MIAYPTVPIFFKYFLYIFDPDSYIQYYVQNVYALYFPGTPNCKISTPSAYIIERLLMDTPLWEVRCGPCGRT